MSVNVTEVNTDYVGSIPRVIEGIQNSESVEGG